MAFVRGKTVFHLAFCIFLLAGVPLSGVVSGEETEVRRMTKEELNASLLLGNPDLKILDVRAGRDWDRSKEKIRGALRADPEKVELWEPQFVKKQTLVLYCASLEERESSSTARHLVARGFTRVYVLKGGWKAWRGAGFGLELK